MEGSTAARGEGSSGQKEKNAPREVKSDRALREQAEANKIRWEKHLIDCEGEGFSGRRSPEAPDKSAPALSPPIMAEKPGDDESPENKGRVPLPAIMAGRSGETEPSLEEKVRLIKVTMSARSQNISVLEIGAPTTQVKPPQGADKTPLESEAHNMAGGLPQTTLFPYKRKKREIKPLVVENLMIVGDRLGQNVISGQPAASNENNFDEGEDGELGDALDKMLEAEIRGANSPRIPGGEEEDVDYDDEEDGSIIEGEDGANGAPLNPDQVQEPQDNPEQRGFEDFNEEGLSDGSVQGHANQPVLTQQIIMDLIVNHPQPIMQPPNVVQGGWEEKKMGYSRLLEGYKSPTGGTIKATLGLGALMFVAVAAESVNRISLMAQQDANEKLVKQAEQHRELMEKEFSANLARIREEHQKTIDETIRIRDECAQLYEKANDSGEDYLQKVDEHQGGELVRMQLEFMKKRADRYAQEIRDNAERHEQELAQEKALTASKEKDLARERLKINELQAEIREFEESLLGLKTTKVGEETLDDKGEAPPKKIKMEVQGTIRAVAVPTVVVPAFAVQQATVVPQATSQAGIRVIAEGATTPYTVSLREQKALEMIVNAALVG
jgi:hypothetical protein